MRTGSKAWLIVVPALTWVMASGCGDAGDGSGNTDETEDSTDGVGDGDGDPGDGDGDPGDGDGDPGDGDGDPGDGDGDPGDGDGEPGDGDGDPGDGDGEPGDGDGDGDGDLPNIPPDDNLSSARHSPMPLGMTEADAGYWEYLPPGYGEGQLYPLLVFWHGKGENGNGDTDLNKVLGHGPPKLIEQDQWPNDRPFIVLSPQHDGSNSDCPSANEIQAFIEYASTAYDVNLNRIYLTGLSCGAIGNWKYLGKYLDSQIAAMVPIAGRGVEAWDLQGCALGSVPIWAFHGDGDDVVHPAGTIMPITNLQACEPPPIAKMTIYEGVGHFSWAMTYNLSAGHDIYAWMLEHSK